jgi:hypothetical protein
VTICKFAETGATGPGLGAGGPGLGAGVWLGDGPVPGAVVLLGAVADFGDAKPVQPARQINARERIIAHRIPTRDQRYLTVARALAARHRRVVMEYNLELILPLLTRVLFGLVCFSLG